MIESLLNINDLVTKSPQDIIDEICSNMYKKENYDINDKGKFTKLPEIIKVIILLIDFDTEISMNGMLGFLENSTGIYLDDTIDSLKKINALEDYEVLKNIKSILKKYGVTTQLLKDNINSGSLYDITDFIKKHGTEYEIMANEINEESEKLYVYQDNRNIFDLLEEFIEVNKNKLIEDFLN